MPAAPASAAPPCANTRGTVHLGDNLPLLRTMKSESVELVYIDPPFNTGKRQARKRIRTVRDENGDRVGFGGNAYRTETIGESGYADVFGDYPAFLRPRLEEAHRILTPNGSLFFHIDWRESARCRLILEDIFGGPQHCINEIIWAYDFGARAKTRWPAKHDNIYWFAKDPDNFVFNYEEIDTVPYMAPGLQTPERISRGKPLTDVWWNSIVPTNGPERTGYATQKPLAIVGRIIRVHSNLGDTVLDFFAGSGTTGEAAAKNGREFILMDANPEAVSIIQKRLAKYGRDNGFPAEKIPNMSHDNKFQRVIEIAESLKDGKTQQEEQKIAIWAGSQLAWTRSLAAGTKGKLGRQLVIELCRDEGLTAIQRRFLVYVENKAVSVKCSVLGLEGNYFFENVKEDGYQFLFCLGISPHDVHAWVIPSEKLQEAKHQHGKADQWMIVAPNNPPELFRECGPSGEIDEALKALRRHLKV